MKAPAKLLFFFVILLSTCQCFVLRSSIPHKTAGGCYQTKNEKDSQIDDSLRQPPVNWRKESILFDNEAATRANNNVLRVWQWMRRRLPLVVTGTRSDENPWGAIYNTVLVRLPTLLAGVLYGKNVVQGHPLIVDLGDGPFEVHPLIVVGILGTILRVPKQSQWVTSTSEWVSGWYYSVIFLDSV